MEVEQKPFCFAWAIVKVANPKVINLCDASVTAVVMAAGAAVTSGLKLLTSFVEEG